MESATNPKTPPEARISAYARFFSTERSVEGEAHLIPEGQLTPGELDRFRELESQLLELFHAPDRQVRRAFQFEAGPVIVVCPDVPKKVRGPLADEKNTNFTKMQQYGDLDALIELYGRLRAQNPTLDVSYRLASEGLSSDDYSSHLILLGGIGWNKVTRHIQVSSARSRSRRSPSATSRTATSFVLGSPTANGSPGIRSMGISATARSSSQTSPTLHGLATRSELIELSRSATAFSVTAYSEQYAA